MLGGSNTIFQKEKAITGLVFVGIFLPVRLVFYTYVSQYWLGSFGLITLILVSLIYLSKKGKLGWIGKIVIRHTEQFAKGKIGKGFMAMSFFSLFFFGNIIYGAESTHPQVKNEIIKNLERQNIKSLDDVAANAPSVRLTTPQLIVGLILLIIPNPLAHSIYAVMNQMSNGWVLHFSTVIFVQELEVLGLVLYFRYVRKTL